MAAKRRRARTDRTELRYAAKELHNAMRAVAAARQKLARVTRPGAQPVVVGESLRWADRLLRSRADALLELEGVVGYGIGRAMKNGAPTNERAITIFVRRKLSPAELKRRKLKPLPRTMSSGGKRIRVDVIEVGELERLASAGDSLGPSNDPHEPEGTLGVFADDLDDGSKVAITAMHVSRLSDFPIDGVAAPEFVVPSTQLHSPDTQRLGVLAFGTIHGVDAAKITLDDPGDASNDIPTIGQVQGWRSVSSPDDDGIPVFLFGAKSKSQQGTIFQVHAQLPSLDLGPVVIADIKTQGGDSGAALVDEQRHVVGFLVGKFNTGDFAGKSVFSAAAAVVDALNCDF